MMTKHVLFSSPGAGFCSLTRRKTANGYALCLTDNDAPAFCVYITNHDGTQIPSNPECEAMKFDICSEMHGTRESVELVGRVGLNSWYQDNVGYSPDEDDGQKVPIYKLIDLVAGGMLLQFADSIVCDEVV